MISIFIIAGPAIMVRKPWLGISMESVHWGLHSFTFWGHRHVQLVCGFASSLLDIILSEGLLEVLETRYLGA
jgi:hypothetical protein